MRATGKRGWKDGMCRGLSFWTWRKGLVNLEALLKFGCQG
ncbi:unnamed protein product [Ectocarpus sp. 8 AP-2014]